MSKSQTFALLAMKPWFTRAGKTYDKQYVLVLESYLASGT